ncbi:hypothetical protein GCM10010840_36330 [Deinococcus aerolatus]|uniref:Uncharacterized protein n=2 Tax=Deinococcus aerolatus TaxID=522487 RepID=A0ABQ2GH70_9DEIO|nr:hypothetical protein GCM10010840_36330 [Deinococcus aerolatus]
MEQYAATQRHSRSLHFGSSGLTLLNFIAALALKDQTFAQQAAAPMDFALTHGLVGINLTPLHAHHQTGQPHFLHSAQDCLTDISLYRTSSS